MRHTNLPLNALRAFEASARHLSFTRAGFELRVTQAAVSHQVKALEAVGTFRPGKTDFTGEFIDRRKSSPQHLIMRATNIQKRFVLMVAFASDQNFEPYRAALEKSLSSFVWNVPL